MTTIAQLAELSEDNIAKQAAAQPTVQIVKWADPADEWLRLMAEHFDRQRAELLRSVREAAQITLLPPARSMAEDFARQAMLSLNAPFKDAMADLGLAAGLSIKGALPGAIAGLGLAAVPSWADTMKDAIAGLGLATDLNWDDTMKDGLAALSVITPFPLPERRQVYLPEPDPEPPAKQIDNEITLESLGAALAEGRLPWREVIRLAMQHMPSTKRGRKEPPISVQLALVKGWYAIKASKRGRRGIDILQQEYCYKVDISRATLNRYERNCKALGLL